MRRISLGICIPEQGVWKSDFGASMALMMAELHKKPIVQRELQRILLFRTEGTGIAKNRHLLVVKALQNKCDYILFLDTDMSFPQNIAHKMISTMLREDVSFLAANCVTRVGGLRPTAYKEPQVPLSSNGKEGVEEVNHVGLGVALLDAKELKKMTPPLFLMDWIPDFNDYCGEDIYFCENFKEQTGKGIFVDHDLSHEILHIGQRGLGFEDLKEEENAS